MLIKYFNLSIIFGILFLGIIETLAKNNESSSKIQIRKKRVINPSGEHFSAIPITEASYIVSIEHKGSRYCVGSILLPRVIITVAHCAENRAIEYQVVAGSHELGSGLRHNVSNIVVHENYNPRNFANDVALLVIYPFIHSSPTTHQIPVHQETIHENSIATIIGWGCPLNSGRLLPIQNLLQRIDVPLMRYDRCANVYQHMFRISEKNICTFEPIQQRRCGVGDFGAPLVLENQLVGMYIWSGTILGATLKPDVFIYLGHIDYRQWIRTKLQHIAMHF